MNDKYMAYPLTVKDLANEIIKACNDYKARRIDNEQIKEIMLWYANTVPEKLFNGAEYNPTVTKIIGSRRIELLNTLLVGYQQRIGGGVNGRY